MSVKALGLILAVAIVGVGGCTSAPSRDNSPQTDLGAEVRLVSLAVSKENADGDPERETLFRVRGYKDVDSSIPFAGNLTLEIWQGTYSEGLDGRGDKVATFYRSVIPSDFAQTSPEVRWIIDNDQFATEPFMPYTALITVIPSATGSTYQDYAGF